MHGLKHDRRRRTGFTLIELLVVMIIIVILATLTVAILPRLNEEQKATRAADQVSGWMLITKGRAKRDRHPVGVRLQVPLVARAATPVAAPGTVTVSYLPWNPVTNQQAPNQVLPDGTLWTVMQGSYLIVADNDQGLNAEVVQVTAAGANQFTAAFTKQHLTGQFPIRHLGYVQTLQYIEQPEDFAVAVPSTQLSYFGVPGSAQVRRIRIQNGTAVLEDPSSPLPPGTIPPDFSGGLGWQPGGTQDPSLSSQWPVQAGDYLELLGGQVHLITPTAQYPSGVDTTPGSPTYATKLALQSVGTIGSVNPTDQYRIIRGPRPLRGEADLQLPVGVVIDLQTNFMFSANNNNYTLPVDGFTGTVDVLFAPSGALVGRATNGTGQVILWVRDTSLDQVVGPIATNIVQGDPALISVYPRTGFIATHPIDRTSGNPYSFTQDGRSSGM
jgi:prepilin-type N-terminal cleavage/methylation domain-containing protein